MTRTTSSGNSVVRLDDGQGQVGLLEKGIVIASSENRVSEWLRELLQFFMRRQHVLRYAVTPEEFDSLVRMPRMAMAFIEAGFFGEATIGCLDRLRKLCPQLRIILFTVSGMQPDEAARYVHWSGGGFISLRDSQELIEEQLKAVFEGRCQLPENIMMNTKDYDLLSGIPPYLTHQEIEIVRCMAKEKTIKETAHCLQISVRTVNNHLNNIYRKFGIRNIVGVLKLAVTQGILSEKELRSYRFKFGEIANSPVSE
jgi:DNA-binding NarL/FixJ family response regulator